MINLIKEDQWSLNIKELKRALDASRSQCIPKALVVINPGNPTGSVLSRKNIEDIINFAKAEKLMIIADEVYQHNVYAEGAEFHSFKKVMTEMGEKIELASLMSASKGNVIFYLMDLSKDNIIFNESSKGNIIFNECIIR